MTAYIIRRLLETILVLLIVSILVFIGMRFLPGDPILMLVSEQELGSMSDERIELLKHEYGLDKPIVVQYFDWMGGLLRGDLGKSIYYRTKVTDEMAQRLPVTLYLGAISFIITVALGIPAGVISAVRRAKFTDTVVTTLANIGITIPNFWLGFILVFIFGLKLRLLPVFGFVFPSEDFALSMKQIIMPVICLSIAGISGIARQTEIDHVGGHQAGLYSHCLVKRVKRENNHYRARNEKRPDPGSHIDRDASACPGRRCSIRRNCFQYSRHGKISHRCGFRPRLHGYPGGNHGNRRCSYTLQPAGRYILLLARSQNKIQLKK